MNFRPHGNTADCGANPGIGIVNPDAIEEFKIQTSMFDAGYGRNPGANVNVVTKSGTNQFHGTAFEFFRNTDLNANDFFRKISPAVGGVPQNGRQVLNQNQFGGRIWRSGEKGQAVLLRVVSGDPPEERYFAGRLFHSNSGGDSARGPHERRAFQAALGRRFAYGSAAGTSNGRHVRLPATARTSIRWPSIFSI